MSTPRVQQRSGQSLRAHRGRETLFECDSISKPISYHTLISNSIQDWILISSWIIRRLRFGPNRGRNDLIYLDMSVLEKDRGGPPGTPRLLSRNWQSRKYKSSFDFYRICQSSKKIDEALRAFVDFYRWIDNPEKIKPRLYTMANDWNIRTNRNIRIQYNTNHGYPYNMWCYIDSVYIQCITTGRRQFACICTLETLLWSQTDTPSERVWAREYAPSAM